MSDRIIPGLKLIYQTGGQRLPDDPSFPFKLEANFRPPEFMNIPHINPRPLGRWKKYSRVILFPWYSNTGMGVTLNIG